jgi:xanthine dehydrogenase accessory factor
MKHKDNGLIVLIKGAGEIASGIAYRVHQERYSVCLTEIPYPLAVSRATAFSDAIFDGFMTISQVIAELTPLSIKEIHRVWLKGNLPVVIDPESIIVRQLKPDVVIDARMLKQTADTKINDAGLVIGIGTGFSAGKDVHIVVETNDRQGNLGKLIFKGRAEANTGIPIEVGGLSRERVVWAPADGVFTSSSQIGEPVKAGQEIAKVNDIPIKAPLNGYLRGLLRDGVTVTKGTKLIEVDSVNEVKSFYTIRDKMWKVGGSVVEALKQYEEQFN